MILAAIVWIIVVGYTVCANYFTYLDQRDYIKYLDLKEKLNERRRF